MHGAPTDPPSSIRLAPQALPPQTPRSEIVFYLNGKRHACGDDTVQLTLAHWLRKHRGLVGTKVMCNEGDCGACSVLVGRSTSNESAPLQYHTIDSCIAFLFQLDRCHIVTVEGLATSTTSTRHAVADNLTAIQKAMVDCHGSQCGFCTPGFIMTMHGMVEANQPLTDDAMRYGLSGNLCRCTGYLQILQAGRQAAIAIDRDPLKNVRLADRFDEAAMIADFESLGPAPIHINSQHQALIPQTVEQACQFRSQYPTAVCVAGGTDYGVLRNHHRLPESDVIYLGQIDSTEEPMDTPSDCRFHEVAITPDSLIIGAGATWSDIERAVVHLAPEYHHILTRFGSPQIRNMGTIGGNLASGSPIADSVPFHLVLDTELELESVRGRRFVRLEDFYQGYRKTILQPDELIIRIRTRLPTKNQTLKLFKISKRRDMDISTVTFALLATIVDDHIVDAKVAVGGVGPTVMRISPTEAFLRGKPWSPETLRAAGRILRQNVKPWTDVRGGADYRLRLVENLMEKSFYSAEPIVAGPIAEVNDEQ